MQQNFTDSTQFYQAAYKMHPKFGGSFVSLRRRSHFESS